MHLGDASLLCKYGHDNTIDIAERATQNISVYEFIGSPLTDQHDGAAKASVFIFEKLVMPIFFHIAD